MKAFIIDLSRCSGCYNCQIACKDEHCGNDWTPYAKPQPDTGQFWIRVTHEEKGTIPKVRVAYLPILCMHCANAPCITDCPIEEAIYRRDDGMVIIDPVKCTGCRLCVDSCPYGKIYFNEDLKLAQKCTGCAHLLDGGHAINEPRCVDACPTEAIKFVDEAELKKYNGETEVLNPEYGTSPRVFYLNIPKKFIAGTVYDPKVKRIVKGATCTLTDERNTFSVMTDGFGDFWFENLEVATYSLRIEAAGFDTKTIETISTQKDVNLGDIPLSQKIG